MRRMEGSSLTRLNKDTLIYMPGRVVPAVMAVVTTSVLTKFVFSVEDFGRYDLTMRLVLFLTTLAVVWLNMVLLRFYPRYAGGENEGVFHGVLALLRVAGIALGLGVVFVVWLVGPECVFGSYRDLLGVGAMVFVGNSLVETGLALARAKSKPLAYSIAATLNALFRLPVGLLLVWLLSGDVAGLLWGFALVPIGIYLSLMRRDFASPHVVLGRAEREFLREGLLYGLPILATLLLGFFLGNLDRFLLKYLRGDAEVGAYAAACQLIDLPIGVAVQTLMLAIFPAISSVYEKQGRQATEALLRQLTQQFLMFCLPIAVLLCALSRPVLYALTSPSFREAYIVAPWLAAAAFFYGMSYYASFGLHTARRSGTLLLVTTFGIGVNLMVNWWTIPRYGYAACGIARLAANLVLVLGMAVASQRHLRWAFPVISLVRIGVASGCAGGLVFVLQKFAPTNLVTLLALTILGGAMYGALLLATGEIPVSMVVQLLRWPWKKGS